jgi:hypothetical protein
MKKINLLDPMGIAVTDTASYLLINYFLLLPYRAQIVFELAMLLITLKYLAFLAFLSADMVM